MTDNSYNLVQLHYGEIAKHKNESSKQQQTKQESVAMAFGYTADGLESLPDKMHLGLSCGNPTVGLANVKEVLHTIQNWLSILQLG